jgi:hypothetical protein
MFLEVPEELRRLLPHVSPAALPPVSRPLAAADVEPHTSDARARVRQLPAFPPMGAAAPGPPADRVQNAKDAQLRDAQRNAQRAAAAALDTRPTAWWEDPVAVGALLFLLPPVGLAAVWGSKRYSSDARWALTVMTALGMCLVSAIAIAGLATR